MASDAKAIAQRRRKNRTASATPSARARAASPHSPDVSWRLIGPLTTAMITNGTRACASIAPSAVRIMNHMAPRYARTHGRSRRSGRHGWFSALGSGREGGTAQAVTEVL